jgi:hypothetical protein
LVIWYIFPVLVCFTKINLATLLVSGRATTGQTKTVLILKMFPPQNSEKMEALTQNAEKFDKN